MSKNRYKILDRQIRRLPVALTQEQILMRLDSWREATTEIAKLQTQIDGIKAELEAPKKTAKEMAAIMRAGTEDGDVWVITKADYEDGIIYEVREDDRTVISQRKMTEADRQERLPEPPPRPVIPD